ncbi:cell division inhibitor SulA [Thalassolituus sp. LLYu03]|uniref:cell division inhibitor SulA n=1 Tax=Thalassolituus sp. LLYu03 TaxID=3421656 RepID=UPI003D2755EA
MRQLVLGMEEPGLSLSSQAFATPAAVTNSRPAGSLTEVIVSDEGAIQPMHLLPMLAQCSAQQRWLMWLSPNRPMNKHWLESMGLAKSPVIHLDLCNDTQFVLCSRVLTAANSHMIVEWQGPLSADERQHLRQLARQSGSHVVLIQREN